MNGHRPHCDNWECDGCAPDQPSNIKHLVKEFLTHQTDEVNMSEQYLTHRLESLVELEQGKIMMTMRHCKDCWGNGYSTVFRGEETCHADFIGDRTYVSRPAGLRVVLCGCDRGCDLARFFAIKKEYD